MQFNVYSDICFGDMRPLLPPLATLQICLFIHTNYVLPLGSFQSGEGMETEQDFHWEFLSLDDK